MFNLTQLNVVLAEQDMTKKDLASLLNIDEATLYRRLKKDGDFRKKEIDKMIGFFGFEKVKSFLFSENLHNANC